ncbi:hypothetical protein LTR37_006190 [Vermiconidia calcicola]|uniref:Uncharacterized protein n=1 Tax=Vermiconidia calcicola TaxID=1690605 RepID=A0ACC3NGV6_9PEZI|nr:hypothetical protein LTR37_006190 [Vermiconidia calcicola]
MKITTSMGTALVTLFTASNLVGALQSKPFRLVAISDNDSVNGTAFNACHEGAAIEGLCPGGKLNTASTYRLNNTRAEPNIGSLNYLLVGGDFKIWEPMSLYVEPSTNVAIPLFWPGTDVQNVAFDNDNKMYISSYVDDTTSPPTTSTEKKLYRWYTCRTYYGYDYTTLAWAQGKAAPQNPSCEKVDVVRVFA